MKFSPMKLFVGSLALTALSLPLAAQSKNPTPQEKKNLQLVLDWWREGFVAGHVEAVDKYLAPDMIQHNPNAPNGNQPVKGFLKGRTPINPIPATIPPDRMPALSFAKGDYVVLVWERTAADPTDPSQKYKYNDFDLFRIADGKIAEHWDGAMKAMPGKKE